MFVPGLVAHALLGVVLGSNDLETKVPGQETQSVKLITLLTLKGQGYVRARNASVKEDLI